MASCTTHYCSRCASHKPLEEFFKRSNGKPRTPCKVCTGVRTKEYEALNKNSQKLRRKAWIQRNQNRWRATHLLSSKKRYSKVRAYLNQYKIESSCVDCGFAGHPAALEFDHVRGIKRLNVSCLAARSASLETLSLELEKCVVRCVCCHRIRTRSTMPVLKVAGASVQRKRDMVRLAKSRPCADCGLKFPPEAMDFDHRDPTQKTGNVANIYQFSEANLREEIAKCRILCGCCHRIRTWSHEASL